ncbi:hypothetical protein CR513_25341, partial [Mucuna pruriens]
MEASYLLMVLGVGQSWMAFTFSLSTLTPWEPTTNSRKVTSWEQNTYFSKLADKVSFLKISRTLFTCKRCHPSNLFLLYMTRSNLGKLHAYEPKIYKTFHMLLRNPRSSKVVNSGILSSGVIASNIVNSGSNYDFDLANIADFDITDFDIANSNSDFGDSISQFILDNMANNDRTLKELATLDVIYQPWCI